MADEQTADKRDLLKTPPVEAEEMERLISKGHQAHNVVGALTFVGIVVLAAVGLYYSRLDKLGTGEGDKRFPAYLDHLVHNQMQKDRETYVTRGDSIQPIWPRQLYLKLRQDIYLLAGAALLLAVIFIHVEKAKMRRNDLLVYRALAREVEKLRMRIKTLEGKGGGEARAGGTGGAGASAPPGAPGSETPTETGL